MSARDRDARLCLGSRPFRPPGRLAVPGLRSRALAASRRSPAFLEGVAIAAMRPVQRQAGRELFRDAEIAAPLRDALLRLGPFLPPLSRWPILRRRQTRARR